MAGELAGHQSAAWWRELRGSSGRPIGDTTYSGLIDAWDPTILLRGRRRRLLTSFRILLHARNAPTILSNESNRSPMGLVLTALGLRALRRRTLVLTEFLPGRRGRLVSWLYRRCLPQACRVVQVMTHQEAADYREWYGLTADQVRVVPFYTFDDRVPFVHPRESGGYLMSTGRNSCDWETVKQATHLVDEDVLVVCPDRDAARLVGVAPGTRVLCDVPRADHDRLLERADALLLVLTSNPRAMGHVRLMSAVTRGVPVIATRVPGLAGYEHLASWLVPPGDPQAVASAVKELVADPERARQRALEIRTSAMDWPRSAYLQRIRSMASGVGEPA